MSKGVTCSSLQEKTIFHFFANKPSNHNEKGQFMIYGEKRMKVTLGKGS